MANEEKTIHSASNQLMDLSLISVLGDREEQQDQSGYILKDWDGFIVVCDGMGGHAEGKKASGLAASHMLQRYEQEYPWPDPTEGMIHAVFDADLEVSCLRDKNGHPVQAGTTLSAIAIQDGFMNWVSVGDSRIYIKRKDELIQITKDHTYRMYLESAVEKHSITEEQFAEELPKGKRLISFVGRGSLPYIDSNNRPFPLEEGDSILLITDGLYKILSDQEILSIMIKTPVLSQMLDVLETQVAGKAAKEKIMRDNMTVAAIRIKGGSNDDYQ